MDKIVVQYGQAAGAFVAWTGQSTIQCEQPAEHGYFGRSLMFCGFSIGERTDQ